MQQKPHLKWFILILIIALALSACERPVPRPEVEEPVSTPDTTIIVPTAPAEGGEETGYPAPGEGEGETPTIAAPTATSEPATGGEETAPTATPPPPEPTATTATQETTYTVVAGDTLYTIAQQFGLTVAELAAANNIVNVNNIEVGKVLTIPAPGSGEATSPPSGERTHVVQPGENLFRIGLQYGFRVDELAEYNGIANPNDLKVGEVIRIPPAQ